MAGRTFYEGQSSQPSAPWVSVAFTTGSDSAVATQSESKSFVTVSKPAGTGLYRLTFADPYPAVMFAKASCVKAAGTWNGKADVVAITNAGTTTPLVIDIQIRQSSDGAALDPAAATIMVTAQLRNTSGTT